MTQEHHILVRLRAAGLTNSQQRRHRGSEHHSRGDEGYSRRADLHPPRLRSPGRRASAT